MANQRFQAVHKTRAGSWLRLASGVLAGCAGLAVTGWAGQAAPQPAAQKPVPAAVQKPSGRAGMANAKPAPAPARKAPAKTTSRAQAGPRRAAKPAAVTQGEQARKEKALPPAAGRRDPFKVPVVLAGGAGESGAAGAPIGSLPPGNRGLMVSQLQVEGILRLDTNHAMIAVVIDSRKLAYFLKKDDVLYDGVVSKITPDAVYFNENHLDPNGRVMTVEVVKRLSPAPGEVK